ncbi:MAG: C-GCAxxG-C-C family protein [Bacteroidota bacterium]
MTKSENAALWFDDTFNCSQSVLASFGPGYGLTEDQCLKIGCAFGGGMARRQMTCGALTGALMALGLHFGRAADDPYSISETTYDKSNQLFEEFKKLHGSINCKELLQGLDMNDPADREKIGRLDLFHTSCAQYVRDAVEITEAIIERGSISPGVEKT